tara:strand:+ start:204 stop:506 length:303 start_codon:yes stop_codon:yes gene_type:complete
LHSPATLPSYSLASSPSYLLATHCEQVLPHFVIGGGVDAGNAYASFDRKQGYALPVLPSTTHELRLEAGSALDADSIVVFSDPVFGNRWGRDQLMLRRVG